MPNNQDNQQKQNTAEKDGSQNQPSGQDQSKQFHEAEQGQGTATRRQPADGDFQPDTSASIGGATGSDGSKEEWSPTSTQPKE